MFPMINEFLDLLLHAPLAQTGVTWLLALWLAVFAVVIRLCGNEPAAGERAGPRPISTPALQTRR